MNQGRCSNSPEACSLAASRTLQPWAGPDSVCAECGAPLARVAPGTGTPGMPGTKGTGPRPERVSPVADPDAYRSTAAAAARPQPTVFDGPDDDAGDPTRGGNGALVLGVLVLAALVAGFVLFRWLDGASADTPAPGFGQAADAGTFSGSVTPVSPPELRRLTATAEALAAPSATASVAATLAAGTMVDVTGRTDAGGERWARVLVPGAAGRSAFVRESMLEPLTAAGDGGLLAPLPGSGLQPGEAGPAPVAPVPPVAGPIETIPQQVLYVVAPRANIRAEAGAGSTRLSEMTRGDTMVALARRDAGGGRIWYQVELPDGRSGWVNADLVSTQRAPDTDQPAGGAPAPAVPAPPAPTSQSREPAAPPPADQLRRLLPPAPPPPGSEAQPARPAGDSAISRGAVVVVQTPQANVRDQPSLNGTVIDEVESGDRMRVQQTTTADGRLWLRVTTAAGITGWISSSTVRLQ